MCELLCGVQDALLGAGTAQPRCRGAGCCRTAIAPPVCSSHWVRKRHGVVAERLKQLQTVQMWLGVRKIISIKKKSSVSYWLQGGLKTSPLALPGPGRSRGRFTRPGWAGDRGRAFRSRVPGLITSRPLVTVFSSTPPPASSTGRSNELLARGCRCHRR